VFEAEVIDPATLVDGEIVETGVGTIFQFIRRDAFVTDYRSDAAACTAVTRAGYRVGWSPDIRGLHLGWDDFRLNPGHLLSKRQGGIGYPESYGEVGLVPRPATPEQLALAAPLIAETRRHGIADGAVLELAWEGPVVGASVPDCVALEAPAGDRLPLDDAAAGAVVLKLPPPARADALVREACRIAARVVVALAPLDTFEGRLAADVAPSGWTGREAPATGDLALAMARAAQGDPALSAQLEGSVADDRERWLELFAAGTFGRGTLRLWIWERATGAPAPDHVAYDADRIARWLPGTLTRPAVRRRGPVARLRARADLAARTGVWRGRLRRAKTRRRARRHHATQ
jgi:hypothetical protein